MIVVDVEPNGHTALGCHIYAGGHTLGVRQAGFDVPIHLEEGPFGVETAVKNLGVEVRVGRSVRAASAVCAAPDRVSAGLDLSSWRAHEFRGCVDWLYGNPPCAAFSTLGVGARVRGEASDYVRCTERLFALIDVVEPTVFSWECVTGALTAGRAFVERMIASVHALGYDVHGVVLDAADCGLPSHRRRFFFVASKVEVAFERPAAPRTTPRGAWAAMAARGFPIGEGRASGNEVKLVASMPPGWGRVRDHAIKIGSKLRPFASRRRLGFDELAPTIAGGPDYYHPTEPRYLTVREQQVLAGYPPEYEFIGSIHQRYAQIGKAVTPPAARWLGGQVARALDAGVKVGLKRRSVFWDFLHERPAVSTDKRVGWWREVGR